MFNMYNIVLLVCLVPLALTNNEEQSWKRIENVLQEQQEVIRQLQEDNAQLKRQQQRCMEYIEARETQSSTRTVASYNVTIEELEIRVERLEEDMFQAQVDISENEIDIDSLEFSLQETIETVMDHSDNLNQLEQDVSNLGSNAEGLENRTSAIEENVAVLESRIDSLDIRTSDMEQIHFETRDSAFYATLSSTVVFEDNYQLIVFENDKINEGGHYNVTSGTYTAPVAGIYQFFAHIRSDPKANLNIYVDGSGYANTREGYANETTDGQAEGVTCTVKLQVGQRVDARTGSVPYTVHGDVNGVASWFGGHLLFPDPS